MALCECTLIIGSWIEACEEQVSSTKDQWSIWPIARREHIFKDRSVVRIPPAEDHKRGRAQDNVLDLVKQPQVFGHSDLPVLWTWWRKCLELHGLDHWGVNPWPLSLSLSLTLNLSSLLSRWSNACWPMSRPGTRPLRISLLLSTSLHLSLKEFSRERVSLCIT